MAQALANLSDVSKSEIAELVVKKDNQLKNTRKKNREKEETGRLVSALSTLGTVVGVSVAQTKMNVPPVALGVVGGLAVVGGLLAPKSVPRVVLDVGIGLAAHPLADLSRKGAERFLP